MEVDEFKAVQKYFEVKPKNNAEHVDKQFKLLRQLAEFFPSSGIQPKPINIDLPDRGKVKTVR